METHVTQTEQVIFNFQLSQAIKVSPVLRYGCAVPETRGRPLAPLAPAAAAAGAVVARRVGGYRR